MDEKVKKPDPLKELIIAAINHCEFIEEIDMTTYSHGTRWRLVVERDDKEIYDMNLLKK